MPAVYNTESAQKLCVIFRDNPGVHVQPVRVAFGTELQFQLTERNVGGGETAREVLEYFEQLAIDGSYAGHSCLAVVMVGCYNARDGWGINVSGIDLDFERIMEPFVKSSVWRDKPKLFFVQYESEAVTSTVCCDASLLVDSTSSMAGGRLPAFADTSLVFGYGGEVFVGMLCDLVREHGSRIEFHQLMTLLNSRVRSAQNPTDDAPLSSGFVSQLTKLLFLATI